MLKQLLSWPCSVKLEFVLRQFFSVVVSTADVSVSNSSSVAIVGAFYQRQNKSAFTAKAFCAEDTIDHLNRVNEV